MNKQFDFLKAETLETGNIVIENHLQGAGGHVHFEHGEVHHVVVGVVQNQKMQFLSGCRWKYVGPMAAGIYVGGHYF